MKQTILLLFLICGAFFTLNAQCPLICNDNVFIGLDHNCEKEITVDDVLENPGVGCNYTIEIFDQNGTPFPGTVVDGSLLGQTIGVKVSLPNGNFCESWVVVEEHIPPVFNCPPNVTLECYENNGTGLPPVYDNCDPNPIIIVVNDNFVDLGCSSQYTGERTISFYARDASGNESDICNQTIYYKRPNLDLVHYPLDRDGSPLPPLDCNNPSWDLDGDGYPDPNEVGVPTIEGEDLYPNGGYCDLWVNFEDRVWPLNCGSKVMRTWVVMDECTGETDTGIQIIKLTSTSAPTISCPPDQTLYANGPDCTGDIALPDATLHGGGCGGAATYSVSIPGVHVYYNGHSWIAENLSPGTYWATYTASGSCGNGTSQCTVKLTVKDGGNGPIPVCDVHTTVSLGVNGSARVYAETFDDGSYDDCGDVDILVRRMNHGNCPPGVVDDTKFRKYIEVCCNDIANSPIQVVLKVTSSSGQMNQCMVFVHVQDKLPPTITCPPNITIDCEYNFDLNDLSEFGRVVTSESARQDIILDDGSYAGRDGLATDNCNVSVTESYHTNISCNQGTIVRRFTATDDFGRSSTCIQRIRVTGTGSNGNNINWPGHVEINECMPDNTHPDYTGYPTWSNSDCSMLAWSYRDEVYTIADGGCVKILRYWSVLDWCTYDPETGHGRYEKIQVIKINEKEPPVMLGGCQDLTFCTTEGNNCRGYIDYHPIFEDCTAPDLLRYDVEVDLYSDGSIDYVKNTANLSGNYPYGTHTIHWEVDDRCGNETKCTHTISVSDCKQPSAVCLAILNVELMPASGMIGLDARIFDHNSFDNCTSNADLIYSWSSNINDNVRVFNCDDLGINEVEMWVTDEAGNQDYCQVTLNIQDNMDACPDSITTIVSGLVSTTAGEPIDNATVSLSHPQIGQMYFDTDAEGEYSFESYLDYSMNDVLVTPYDNSDVLNGVTSFDLFVIYKFIQGQMDLDEAESRIAADINKDGKINAQDVLHLKQLLLGVFDEFPQNTSWVFVNADPGLNPDNPHEYLDHAYVTTPLAENTDFTGVKVGDVNNSVTSGLQSEHRTNSPFTLTYEEMHLEAGESYSVLFKASTKSAIKSFQMYLQTKGNGINIEEITPFVKNTELWQKETESGHNTVALFEQGNVFDKGEAVFKMSFRANQSGHLSQYLAVSESRLSLFADFDGSEHILELRTDEIKDPEVTAAVNSVEAYPNPVADEWNLRVMSKSSVEVELILSSVSGKQVILKDLSLEKGTQDIQIQAVKSLEAGIYFYQIVLDDEVFKGSLIKL